VAAVHANTNTSGRSDRAGQVWERRMRCRDTLKPLIGTRGWKAHPVEPDQRLEARLARGVGNPHREAETTSPKAMLWSAERPFVGALTLRIPGAALRHRNGLVPAVLPASTEQGERTIGVPQEPGRSGRLLRGIPGGRPGHQLRASAVHSSAG